ncbi:hypothetical protein RhiirA5_348244 [Rhizophagus irregularis]|uniref:Uncharacterized protein n=3 Tax=Rhizophagus irregularis TaxID=588596 RepID=A0A2I1E045_9GLOM|nr:hypothetical protein GLOIN_2v1514892 [Rhizophagus irregularis DAOM 181602=DAOM 197198]PKC16047.1 hypothetical protein RhiirA5_348244 [Rhizophagus irregularis]PKC74357.1 hypothetical protein RhiirA1_409338 [Rhizophagus irregularis]PKK75771.1 hypothetical protein RhiirC2_735900 [Rhizophagus irregularis]PKY15493.1 hypothetical protein RhiirB3_401682 [Rhizophagus irregularis]POG80695.1 hypothetical protein GLOIN_2v1514892 [Rhizophagus irregularis DAOM 181602=DAOM 197198]|eukprot:XP_025187561.1 hypothetical protein GLOIN_2v1514892 [Rhizophagus irregularis DAOM 181602=DAOM 197198]
MGLGFWEDQEILENKKNYLDLINLYIVIILLSIWFTNDSFYFNTINCLVYGLTFGGIIVNVMAFGQTSLHSIF